MADGLMGGEEEIAEYEKGGALVYHICIHAG